MKPLILFLISLSLLFCTPKGPQTYSSPYVGKTKTDLIATKGLAKTIKIFDTSEAHIYKVKEEYYGKKVKTDKNIAPKKVYETEHIYYINKKGYIYKYQVWKKRID